MYKSLLLCICLIQTISLATSGSSPGAHFSVISSPFLRNHDRTSFNSITNSKHKYVPRSPSALNASNHNQQHCPKDCICRGLSIDCSRKSLVNVIGSIPSNLIRVDLQENRLAKILNTDFSYLSFLKVL